MPGLRTLSLFVLSLAAACGDEVTPPSGTPSRITVSTETAPILIAFRDGLDAVWQTPAASATGVYAFDVHGPYIVTVVCEIDGLVMTAQIARTPDDDRELDMDCFQWNDAPFSVTGTMAQPGMIGFDNFLDFSDTPNWQFHLRAGPEPHDLLAIAGGRIVIRRGLVFGADATIMDVDVAQEGVALAPASFTATNATAGEALDVVVELGTATTLWGLVYSGPPTSAKIIPSAVLNATDQQTVWMTARRGELARFVGRDHRAGDATAFALPDPMGAPQVSTAGDKVVGTWDTLPEGDMLYLVADGFATDGIYRVHDLALSPRFMAETGATEAALDAELPGYLPAWRLDFSKEHTIRLAAMRKEAGEVRGSDLRRTINAPVPRARPRGLQRPRSAEWILTR